jgi:hypothetical protein
LPLSFEETMKKKLTLRRTALRPLTDAALANVQGGTYYYYPVGTYAALSVVVSSLSGSTVGASSTLSF